MSRRAILALSATLSAFVLVLAGAAASYSLRSPSAPVVQAADTVPADVVRAREAEYRRLIDEANVRLRNQQTAVAMAPAAEPVPVTSHELEHGGREEEERRSGRPEHRRAHREDDDG